MKKILLFSIVPLVYILSGGPKGPELVQAQGVGQRCNTPSCSYDVFDSQGNFPDRSFYGYRTYGPVTGFTPGTSYPAPNYYPSYQPYPSYSPNYYGGGGMGIDLGGMVGGLFGWLFSGSNGKNVSVTVNNYGSKSETPAPVVSTPPAPATPAPVTPAPVTETKITETTLHKSCSAEAQCVYVSGENKEAVWSATLALQARGFAIASTKDVADKEAVVAYDEVGDPRARIRIEMVDLRTGSKRSVEGLKHFKPKDADGKLTAMKEAAVEAANQL